MSTTNGIDSRPSRGNVSEDPSGRCSLIGAGDQVSDGDTEPRGQPGSPSQSLALARRSTRDLHSYRQRVFDASPIDSELLPHRQEVLHARDSVGQTSGATQRCLKPGCSERIGNSRRTGVNTPASTDSSFLRQALLESAQRLGATMSTRLNLRVVAVFSIVSLPLLAVAALLTIGAGRSDLRESYGLQLMQIAEHIASATDAVVYRLVINASMLGHHPNLRDAASAATRVAYNEAATHEFDESWQRASSIPGPPAALLTNTTSRFFADLISQDSFSSEILLTDRFGRLVAASGLTSDFFQADEVWWTGAFGDGIRGRLFVSGVGYDESAQTEAIAIAVPVTTEDSVVGVIKVITDIRAITTLVSGMRIGVTGDATLVRPNGSIVISRAGPSAPPADFFASGVLRERLGDVPSGNLVSVVFLSSGDQR